MHLFQRFRFMFLKKQIAAIIFLLTTAILCGQEFFLHSLQLSYSRNETFVEEGLEKTSLIKGEILYKKNPYIFVFSLQYPENQVFLQTEGGTYLLMDGEYVEAEDAALYLTQTCNDFLNWFKSDFGLGTLGYVNTGISKEGDEILSLLSYSRSEDFELPLVKMYTDSAKNIKRLQTLDSSNTVVAESYFENYLSQKGCKYPSLIKTRTYADGHLLSESSLNFTKTVINGNLTLDIVNEELKTEKLLKIKENVIRPEYVKSPADKDYQTSTTGILVTSAYAFYKKFITDQDIPGCAFNPTCSAFMLEAVRAHGLFGIIEGLDHLKRCNTNEIHRDIYERDENGKIIERVKK